MQQTNDIIELLGKHLNASLNQQEAETLESWINAKPENQELVNRLDQNDLLMEDIRLYWDLWNDAEAIKREQRIFDKVTQKTAVLPVPLYKRIYKWVPYAAAAILMLASALYFFREPQKITETEHLITAKDILPGGNRAILTLENGRSINLNSHQSGIIVGKEITYLDGSSIADSKAENSEKLVLKTPVGGNYKVVLPDGSQVWLNADSKLTYPSRFAATERIVQLEGEAYFEVQHQYVLGKKIPFKVVSNGQTVNVLGTAFNISAYAEEPQMKTTLVNGTIEIENHSSKNSNKMVPGQQAILEGTNTKINKVDIFKSIAWKYGQFSFDDKSFDQIMREMARWYNIKVTYEGGIPTDRFTGNAFKTDKLGTVLRFLESSGIQYQVKSDDKENYQVIINNTTNRRKTITN